MIAPEPKEKLLQAAKRKFAAEFPGGRRPHIAVFAPGRVNLIGEHTDYTGGLVMPFALEMATVIVGEGELVDAGSPAVCQVASALPGSETAEFSAEPGQVRKGAPAWANYVKGVVAQYLGDVRPNKRLRFRMAVASSVPVGSGLSSSASLEVAVATFLERVTFNPQPLVTRALRCQKAEHDFADTPCGIMDQFISALGKEGCLLKIDCDSKRATHVHLSDASVALLVTNSQVQHSLGSSEYPQRVAQCRAAEDALRSHFGAKNFKRGLRDATAEQVERLFSELQAIDEVTYRRARHVVGENRRVAACAAALGGKGVAGRYEEVGKLMNESHNSLRDDFEVSCAELDELVDIARRQKGVYGSRMTGGGFGGCTVTLVEADRVADVARAIVDDYEKSTGRRATCFASRPGPGAGDMELRGSALADALRAAAQPPVIGAAVAVMAAVGILVLSVQGRR